jgi:glycosyltransferase involved in cell wall biosynthesis
VPSVLHLLPHSGGGGERYVDLLASMPGYVHERAYLSASRSPIFAGPSILARRPRLSRRARRFDLLHLHGDVAAMLALPLLARQPGLVSTHGLSFLRRAGGAPLYLAHRRWSEVADSARTIVCSSQTEQQELLALDGGRVRARLAVVPNGIALPAWVDRDRRRALRAELGIADHEVAGLFLGQLDRYKDPLTAVAAAQIVRKRGIPFTLLVAGDGPLLADARRQAGEAVRMLGFRHDPQPLLQAADVFVMSSTREGSSYALLEAMGHGLAIVACDGSGIAEMVGDTGIIVPVGEVEAFAEGLARLASDPLHRTRLGVSARERVRECFGIDRFIASMHALYDGALAAREPCSAAPGAAGPASG